LASVCSKGITGTAQPSRNGTPTSATREAAGDAFQWRRLDRAAVAYLIQQYRAFVLPPTSVP